MTLFYTPRSRNGSQIQQFQLPMVAGLNNFFLVRVMKMKIDRMELSMRNTVRFDSLTYRMF